MKQHILTGTALLLIAAGIVLLAVVLWKLAALLVLVLVAVVLTTGIDPLVTRLQRIRIAGRPVPRALATILVLFLGLLVLAGAMSFLVATAVREAIVFSRESWPELQGRLLAWFADLSQRYPAIPSAEELYGQLRGQSGNIARHLLTATQAIFGVIGGVFSLVTVIILTLFFTTFKDGITFTFSQFVPRPYQGRFHQIGHLAAQKMGGWLRGQIILAFLITLISLVGMWALGVPYPMLIALIGGIGELIPMVGPYLAFFPAIIIALVSGLEVWQIVGIFVFFGVLSQVENYYLSPRIMERQVELSPITTILALLVGGSLLGIVGALLAIPVAAAGRVILLEAIFPAIQNVTRAQIEAERPDAPPPPPTQKKRKVRGGSRA